MERDDARILFSFSTFRSLPPFFIGSCQTSLRQTGGHPSLLLLLLRPTDRRGATVQRTAVISDAGCSSVYFSSEAKQQVDPFFFACGTQRGLRRHTSHYPGFFAQSSITTVSARLSVADLFF